MTAAPEAVFMRLVNPVLRVARRMLSPRTKRFLKRIWDPTQNLTVSEIRVLSELHGGTGKFLRGRSREATNLLPGAARTFDVVAFGIFDWRFRFQRPQQILTELARRGHRIFYVASTASAELQKGSLEPIADNIWQVGVDAGFDLYAGATDPSRTEHLQKLLASLRSTYHISTAVQMIQFPSWWPICAKARQSFGWKIVYDCMDDWEHMEKVGVPTIAEERELVRESDLVLVSSRGLRDKWSRRLDLTLHVPNAADFATFNNPPDGRVLAPTQRPVIGYFGAVAEWFDLDLVAHAALERPGYTFVIVGEITHRDAERLRNLPNVFLTGEKPYGLMPVYLREFDACIIPFRQHPVIDSTNPVKLYEYFSQGKPVVATKMRELQSYTEPVLYTAENEAEFVQAIDRAVAETDLGARNDRIRIARENTWQERVDRIEAGIGRCHPLVSIVMVTFNNLEYTRVCLDSLNRNTLYPSWEVILVDNASTDGTPAFLEQAALNDSRIRVILNSRNAGFAAATNQGLQVASGDFLILLNNDIVVPNGWMAKLLRHLDDQDVGLVVPVTNYSGNESRIDVSYRTLEQMDAFAHEYTRRHDGEIFDIRVAAMYCVAMRRSVFEQIGPLDERFSIGMFEDDDYSHRIRLAGLRVVCADDAFVHHFGQASFRKLKPDEYEDLFRRNQRLFEEKWQIRWEPHRGRASASAQR